MKLHPDLLALKATTHALISACGGAKASSKILDGKSASLISSYGNQNVPDRFMPLDDVTALESAAGRPIVSAWMAERALADPDRPRRCMAPADIAPLAKESAEAVAAVATAFIDGRFCAADRLAVVRELRDLQALVGEMIDAAEGAR